MRRFENLKSSYDISNRIDAFQDSNRIDISRMVSIGFERKPVSEKAVLRPLDCLESQASFGSVVLNDVFPVAGSHSKAAPFESI